MLTVVASPHMAQFLLGDEEDLLNDKTRMIRNELAKYNGRPSEEFIEGVENEDEREALRKLCDSMMHLIVCGVIFHVLLLLVL